jgi:hypothetical protein
MQDFTIPNKETQKPSDRSLQIQGTREAVELAKFFGLQRVQIVNAKSNPYDGKAELQLNYDRDEKLGLSSLGTPIYTDLTLLGVDYTDNLTGRYISLPNDRFRSGSNQSTAGNSSGIGVAFYMNLETVLMTVTKPKRVIKTEIQGRDGTVKEYIGADDMQITINVKITGRNGVYPRDEVNRLIAWLDAPVSKGIVAWWLDNIGVSDIVIESYTMPQVEGGYSYQMFAINAISDAPVELKITTPIQ